MNRYTDLMRVHTDMESEIEKLRNALTSHQDKSLQRISELREQCALDRSAKTRLEKEVASKDERIAKLAKEVSLIYSAQIDFSGAGCDRPPK